jgi:arylsulfatase
METIDDEFLAGAIKFIDKAHKEGKPFFVWANTSRMHNYTHLPKEYQDMVAEKGFYGAGMTQHDRSVGQLLAKLDDLGITENTIVIYSTDNGAMKFSWPDGGTSPFRGEKATTWEAGFRVPCMVRWPGVVKPGTIINDIFHHMDWMPTLLAALGEPDLKEKLLKGHKAAGKTFKVHLDGYNQLPVLKGQRPSTRQEIWYISDDGDLCALRYNKWKITFLKQEAVGRNVWVNNYTPLRAPELSDLRADPFEHASKPGYSMGWEDWWFRRAYLFVPAQGVVAGLVKSFKEFPPRGKPASFSVGDALKMIEDAHSGSGK